MLIWHVQVRDTVFNMRNDMDPYGIQLGYAINAVSALRGTVSASATDADNYSDQGITINGVTNVQPHPVHLTCAVFDDLLTLKAQACLLAVLILLK